MKQVRQMLELTNEMSALADEMNLNTKSHNHKHVLAVSLRDAAYSLREKANKEKERLQKINMWDK